MISITATGTVTMLNAAVEDRGADYVYQRPNSGGTCLYVHGTTTEDVETGATVDNDNQDDWTPGCIVGHVLHQAGVSLEDLKANEKISAGEVIAQLTARGVITVGKVAKQLLADTQVHQDDGVNWGESVKRALESSVGFAERELDRTQAKLDKAYKRIENARAALDTYNF